MGVDVRKAYGYVTALGTKLGEKARSDPDLVGRIRATADAAAFRDLVRAESAGLVPPAVADAFVGEVVTDDDWIQWRSRLLLQVKMVRDGGKPAPGHESGKKGATGR